MSTGVPLDVGGKLLLVGAGKMGGAMLEGWLDLGLDPGCGRGPRPAPPGGDGRPARASRASPSIRTSRPSVRRPLCCSPSSRR